MGAGAAPVATHSGEAPTMRGAGAHAEVPAAKEGLVEGSVGVPDRHDTCAARSTAARQCMRGASACSMCSVVRLGAEITCVEMNV